MALVAFVLLERGFAQDVAPKGTDVPGQPAPPVFVASNSTSLSVSWAMPEVDGGSPVLWYMLYGGDTAESLRPFYDPFRAGAAPEPNVRNFTIRRLRPSTRYRFMIAARNAVGQSKFTWSQRRAHCAVARSCASTVRTSCLVALPCTHVVLAKRSCQRRSPRGRGQSTYLPGRSECRGTRAMGAPSSSASRLAHARLAPSTSAPVRRPASRCGSPHSSSSSKWPWTADSSVR